MNQVSHWTTNSLGRRNLPFHPTAGIISISSSCPFLSATLALAQYLTAAKPQHFGIQLTYALLL